MKPNRRKDDLLRSGGHCGMCGRYFDINEVNIGVYTEYFLLHRADCPCPTCFGHQLHRVEDPTLADVLDRHKYCDHRPRSMMTAASLWASPYVPEEPTVD